MTGDVRARQTAPGLLDAGQGLWDMLAGSLRGVTRTALATPGDVERLLRAGRAGLGKALSTPPGVALAPGEVRGATLAGLGEDTYLPNSEDWQRWLPDVTRGQAPSSIEQLAGFAPVNPLSPLRAMSRFAQPAATALGASPLGKMSTAIASVGGADLSPGVSMAIKPKGGNWLGGPASELETYLGNMKWVPEARAPEPGGTAERTKAVEAWIDKQLKRYVQTDMGTAGDPLLQVEREGRLHLDPEQFQMDNVVQHSLPRYADTNAYLERPGYERGTPKQYVNPYKAENVFHQQATGRVERTPWEQLSEFPIRKETPGARVGEINEYSGADTLGPEYAWLGKLAEKDPAAAIYDFPQGMTGNVDDSLGFGHVVDYLRQSGMTPEQLSRVSVADAVRGTHDWSERMLKAKQTESLGQGIKGVHKEYPEGMRWVELGAPDAPKELPPGYELVDKGGAFWVKSPEGHPYLAKSDPERAVRSFFDEYGRQQAEKGLKAEGEAMGHCVGGYCEPVLSGRTRILSLRDSENKPHATVELAAPHHEDLRRLDPSKLVDPKTLSNEEMATLDRKMIYEGRPNSALYANEAGKNGYVYHPDYPSKWIHPDSLQEPRWQIRQIKGKGNAALAARYQPYAQDLVKSGDWHPDVGDLRNAGLHNVKGSIEGVVSDLGGADWYDKAFPSGGTSSLRKAAVDELGRHATKEEMKAWVMKQMED